MVAEPLTAGGKVEPVEETAAVGGEDDSLTPAFAGVAEEEEGLAFVKDVAGVGEGTAGGSSGGEVEENGRGFDPFPAAIAVGADADAAEFVLVGEVVVEGSLKGRRGLRTED